MLGRAARLDLGQAETAHVLCAGTTGSGKSFLLRALLWQAIQAAPDRLQVLFVDTKRELERFYGLPHLAQPAARDASGAAALLEWVAGSMTERTPADPPLVIVIDELADVVATSKATIPALARIARLGRSLGLHILAGTQYVSKDTLGDPQLKANLTCRLAGRVENAQASALATGHPDMGAHRLSGSGDFLLASGGRAVRFTGPVLTDDQLATLPAVTASDDGLAWSQVPWSPRCSQQNMWPGCFGRHGRMSRPCRAGRKSGRRWAWWRRRRRSRCKPTAARYGTPCGRTTQTKKARYLTMKDSGPWLVIGAVGAFGDGGWRWRMAWSTLLGPARNIDAAGRDRGLPDDRCLRSE